MAIYSKTNTFASNTVISSSQVNANFDEISTAINTTLAGGGNAILATKGGTGQTSIASGDVLYGSATNTISKLAIGSANQVLQIINGLPSWQTVNLSGINYINANPAAETDTTGWSTYADAAGNIPVDGTGGSPNTTWTRTTSTPLRGSGSFLWTKSTGASRQGEGVGYAFTIDVADKAKPLAVTFDYIPVSGTFTAADGITAPKSDGTTTTGSGNSDIQVFIYDVTNAALIPVTPTVLVSNSTTTPATFKGTFQTASNSTSYRLILHTAMATNAALTMQFDNFAVGPQSVAYGTASTDWTAYTPTFTGLGTVSNASAYYRREGKDILVIGSVTTGTVAGSVASVSLPSGVAIDTASVSVSNSSANPGMAVGTYGSDGTAGSEGAIITATGTSTTLVYLGGLGSGSATITPANGSTIAGSSKVLTYSFRIPVQGYSSTVLMSNDTDTRVVAMRATSSATTATSGAWVTVVNPTIAYDSHGAYNSSTGVYTVPVSGYYEVSTGAEFSKTWQQNTSFQTSIRQNGTGKGYGITSMPAASAAGLTAQSVAIVILKCAAGDTIDYQVNQNATGDTALDSSSTACYMQIQRLSGPATIAATESVNARYKLTAVQSVANTTTAIINFDTKEKDTHGAVTTGASWKFTAPVSGEYLVATFIDWPSNSTGQRNLILYKNGSQFKNLDYISAPTAQEFIQKGTSTVSLVAGDYIDIRVYQASGGALNVGASTPIGDYNTISITRIGN